jgi:outer membrane protein assembly factor BamB
MITAQRHAAVQMPQTRRSSNELVMRTLVTAAICASAIQPVNGAWTSLGGNAYRASRAEGVLLPSPNAGTAVSAWAPPNVTLAATPLVSAEGLIVLTERPCNITFLSANLEVLARWSACALDTALAPSTLDANGTTLLGSTDGGITFALTASLPHPGRLLWAAQRPLTPNDTFIAAPLADLQGNVWYNSVGGSVFIVSASSGQATPATIPAHVCGGRASALSFTAAPTLAGGRASLVLAISTSDCVLAFRPDGTLQWAVSNTTGADGGARTHLAGPAAADPDQRWAAFAWAQGLVCCLRTDNGTLCDSWAKPCISVTSSTTITTGIALSPATTAFYGGTAFVSDDAGAVFAVELASASFESTGGGFLQGAVAAAPIIVPNAWVGYQNVNALLVCTSAGSVYALSVGNGVLQDDDDGTDDDGIGTAGVVWQVRVGAQANVTGAMVVRAPGMALTDNGTVLIPGVGGLYILQQSSRLPPVSGRALIIVVISVCTLALVLGIAVAMWFARRRRQKLYFPRFAAIDGAQAFDGAEYAALAVGVPAADLSVNASVVVPRGGSSLRLRSRDSDDAARGDDDSPVAFLAAPEGQEYLY